LLSVYQLMESAEGEILRRSVLWVELVSAVQYSVQQSVILGQPEVTEQEILKEHFVMQMIYTSPPPTQK
jgi:hypothetical protein